MLNAHRSHINKMTNIKCNKMLKRLELERNLRYNISELCVCVKDVCLRSVKRQRDREQNETIRSVCSTFVVHTFASIYSIKTDINFKLNTSNNKTAKKNL